VGSVPITASEVEKYLWDWRAYEVVQDLITSNIMLAEAKRAGVSVGDAEIDREMAAQIKLATASAKPGVKPDRALLEQGFSRSRLYLRIRSQLILDKLTLRQFKKEEFVEIATIVVRPKSEQAADLAEAIQKAQRAYDDLRNGVSWDVALQRFEKDPQVLKTHGYIGWRNVSLFPESVRKEVLSSKPGAITRPAQTPNGIQIFRVDRFGRDASGSILENLRDAYLQGTRQQVLDRIRKAAKVTELYPKG
jgi:parvulin-like peptidyl-prolyl isomerase